MCIEGGRRYYRLFMEALSASNQRAVREAETYGRSKALFVEAKASEGTPSEGAAYEQLYDFARTTLLAHRGTPSLDLVQIYLDRYRAFSLTVNHSRHDVETFVDTIYSHRDGMFKVGAWQRNNEADEKAEMELLWKKIPLGSKISDYFLHSGGRPQDLRIFIVQLQTWCEHQPKTAPQVAPLDKVFKIETKGVGVKAVNVEDENDQEEEPWGGEYDAHAGYEGEAGEEDDFDVWANYDDEFADGTDGWWYEEDVGDYVHYDSYGIRTVTFDTASHVRTRSLNDARHAQMDLNMKRTEPPVCSTCHGKHHVRPCPNARAKADTTFNPMNAPKCDFVAGRSDEERRRGTMCNGVGHLRHHHKAAEMEGILAKGTKTYRIQGTSKLFRPRQGAKGGKGRGKGSKGKSSGKKGTGKTKSKGLGKTKRGDAGRKGGKSKGKGKQSTIRARPTTVTDAYDDYDDGEYADTEYTLTDCELECDGDNGIQAAPVLAAPVAVSCA